MQQNAVLVGVVADLDDPEGLGRVRVRYPTQEDSLSNWARLASPMAGNGSGFRFVPEVGDEVLLVHELGDKRRPYVLGALWSSVDQPPVDDGDPVANNWRTIVSRSGHLVKLDDTAGAEKIEITDRSGALHVVLDSAGPRIEVTADRGDVAVRAAGAVTVEAAQLTLKATGAVTIEAGTVLTITGKTGVDIN